MSVSYNRNFVSLLLEFNYFPLHQRRLYLSLISCYKILIFRNWFVSINSSDYYMLALARERRGVHLEQLFSESSRNNYMKEYCFF